MVDRYKIKVQNKREQGKGMEKGVKIVKKIGRRQILNFGIVSPMKNGLKQWSR
jgi:hypothetical protein